jgi:hypothetical protein
LADSSEGNARLRQAPPAVQSGPGRVQTLAPPAPPLAPRYRAPIVGAFALQLPGLPDPETLRIHAAVPDGYRRPRSVAAWQRQLDQHPALQGLRSDADRNARAVLWALARLTDRQTFTARPTWAVLMARTGLSRSTIASWLAWARRHRLIGHVEQGSTERFRAGQDPVDIGNRAAVYVLLIPRPSTLPEHPQTTITETRTPSRPPTGPRTLPRTHARTENMRAALRAAGDWSDTANTRTQAQRLAAVRLMQFRSPVARTISDRHLRHLCRDFLLAGWSARELMYALDHKPDGTSHPYAYNAADLRVPAGWIAHRLRFWRDASGSPIAGYRQTKQRAADQRPRPVPTTPEPTLAAPTSTLTPRGADPVTALARDRLAREAANRERSLPAASPEPARLTAHQRSALIRARALARARQDRAAGHQ